MQLGHVLNLCFFTYALKTLHQIAGLPVQFQAGNVGTFKLAWYNLMGTCTNVVGVSTNQYLAT